MGSGFGVGLGLGFGVGHLAKFEEREVQLLLAARQLQP